MKNLTLGGAGRALGLVAGWWLGAMLSPAPASGAPVRLTEQAPVTVVRLGGDRWLVDFGRVAFGNLRLQPAGGPEARVTVHFGEAQAQGRVERKPPGTVRYAVAEVTLAAKPVVVAPAPDARNTRPPAVLTPAEWGVVLPFRWVEIEGWPGDLRPEQIRRRAAFDATWDDQAAAFRSSDELLNRVWDLCLYSIKATTFAGVFVDGDRERIAYEADAYLNQLSYYAGNADVRMARDTYDHLMAFPTWPTEWASHMVLMADADWRHTGDRAWLAARFEALRAKLLLERVGPDGLVVSSAAQIKHGDIVDWPLGERDGYVFRPVNTVINAFYLHALNRMAALARDLGRDVEAAEYGERFRVGLAAFQARLFDPVRGLYVDGEGTEHASLHANLFPLAFGLVPEAHRPGITRWLTGRGMACSVYAAQYLLEALFMNGADREALALMLAPGDRSWRYMVESGTTITWEAWAQHYKPNQDWNHAWGAAPANLLPRFVLGVQPLEPGWARAQVRPQPGGLAWSEGRVPTPQGPIDVRWARDAATFTLTLALPPGMPARIEVPAASGTGEVRVNGRAVRATQADGYWRLADEVTGRVVIEVR